MNDTLEEGKKRVICLYRVSTTQQVYKSQDNDRAKDDIPMQKIVCRDFADKMDWIIVDEMYEKGVSGYKKSANDRDAIIELLRILRNHIYRGFLQRGDAKSDRMEALQIISDEDFFKAQDILDQRARKDESKRTISLTNKGKTLLSGNIYCAHCGCRLATTSYVERYKRKDGSMYEKPSSRYICYHRSRGLNNCDGATTYLADRIDRAVTIAMRKIFQSISGCPQEEKIEAAYKSVIAGNHKLQQKLNYELQRDMTQLESLRLEIGKALTGESVYSQEDLATAIATIRKRITDAQEQLEKLMQEDAAQKAISDSIIPAYKQFKTWAEEFDGAPLEMKKMIASQLFSRIEIGKGYEIHLELDTTFQTFCDEWTSIQKLTAIA